MIGSALDVSSSALVAQRTRMDIIAGNIANAYATRQDDGTVAPYQRRVVTFSPARLDGGVGVQVDEIRTDDAPPRLQYDPGHPDAINSGPLMGYVRYPNVNVTMEYVDAMSASRAYEANLAMLNVTRRMLQQSIQLFA